VITLKDVAKECNVSFSTVSKALKNSSEISSETIRQIQKKATEMGYHPNIAARTLRTNKAFDIGVIFEDKTGSGLQHQYFAKIISGLQKTAQKYGYEITFTGRTTPSDSFFDYYNHIKSRNFDGVTILSADFTKKDIQKLVHSEIPTVTLDYFYDRNHTYIMSDNDKGMRELVEYAISMGHKKIALIHGENTFVTKERTNIFLEIIKDHGISIPSEYLVEAMYHDPKASEIATKYLLSLDDKPTCIFYPDDYSALGGIQVLNKLNLTPGKDISIAGYDGIMLTSLLVPPLTTYEQDGETIGKLMVENLINKIENNNDVNCQRILVTGHLLKGGSIAKI
jgi:LacI family transcriptional regulator